MSKTSLFRQISVIAIFGTQDLIFQRFAEGLKLTHIGANSLLMSKTSLFRQISVIAIFGTQDVIFQSFAESAEIKAHQRS